MTPCAVEGCERTKIHARRMCSLHYNRWQRSGDPGPAEPSDSNRPLNFWSLVDKGADGGCWLWRGRLNEKGYGRVHVGKRNRRVHRYIYEQLVGPIPEGLHIDHLCRVRNCVNPAHLEPVTLAENNRRRWVAEKEAAPRRTA